MPRTNEIKRIIQNDGVEIAKRISGIRENGYRDLPRAKQVEFLIARGEKVGARATARQVAGALERIIGEHNDLRPIAWLAAAITAADAVAKINFEDDNGELATATGFMISPRLMMTNHHVFQTAAQAGARSSFLTFRDQSGIDNRPADREVINLDPATFFTSNKALDYAVFAVADTADGQAPGTKYGYLPLIKAPSKSLPGTPLNIIQHPDGRPKEIAFRNNLMTDVESTQIAVYLTDTEPGSSGSPVLNDDFDVVALHHAGYDLRDENGNKIDLNGDPVTENHPESLRCWIANEGIRISAIVAHLEAARLSAAKRTLVKAAIIATR